MRKTSLSVLFAVAWGACGSHAPLKEVELGEPAEESDAAVDSDSDREADADVHVGQVIGDAGVSAARSDAAGAADGSAGGAAVSAARPAGAGGSGGASSDRSPESGTGGTAMGSAGTGAGSAGIAGGGVAGARAVSTPSVAEEPVPCNGDDDCRTSTILSSLWNPICDPSTHLCGPCPAVDQQARVEVGVVTCLSLLQLEPCKPGVSGDECLILSCHRSCGETAQ